MNKQTFFALCVYLSLFTILETTPLTAQPLNNHLQFDGTDDYISLNNMDVVGNAITLEALINSTKLDNCFGSQCRIISKASGTPEGDHYWMLSTINNGTNDVLRFRVKTNGTTKTLIAPSGALSENTWYHIAATYNGSVMKLFLDGNEVASTPKTGPLTTNPSANSWIGGNPPNASNLPWHGGIDEVRIWNTARTQAELQANKNIELTGNEPGLQAYYQFNEGTGQTINDATGNNNTLLGSTSGGDTNDPTFAGNNPNPNGMVTCNLKVYLEGPFDQTQSSMNGNLLLRGVVPPGQPYTGSPWNYPGTEGSGWLPSDYPAGTVDWVLVSIWRSLDPTSQVARVAAVLLDDGSISPFDVNLNNSTAPVYVMVEHHNHLPILSAQPIPVVQNMLSYDFRTQDSYNPTGFGQKQIGSDWMMYAGNGDQDSLNRCDINAGDRILWQSVNGLFGVYNPGDYDLDGDINAADRIVFNDNNGIFTSVPKPGPTGVNDDDPRDRPDLGTEYYVSTTGNNNNNGSMANPWRTIGHALNTVPIVGDATIWVADGQYIEFAKVVGRKFTDRVWLLSENPYCATIINPSSNRVIRLSQCSNIGIDGFDISGSNTTDPGVFFMDGGDKHIIRNNIIHDSYNNDIMRVLSTNNTIIEKNIFYNQEGSDEHVDVNNGARGVIIRDNIFFNDFPGSGRPLASGTKAFIVVKTSANTRPTGEVSIRRNIFMQYQGRADMSMVQFGGDNRFLGAYESQDCLIENNLLLLNGEVNQVTFSILGSRRLTFNANTIVGPQTNTYFLANINRGSNNPMLNNIKFSNNICSDPSGTMPIFSDSRANIMTGGEINNNLYHNGGNSISANSNHVIIPQNDAAAITANPILTNASTAIAPRFNRNNKTFAGGYTSIRDAFVTIVSTYGKPGAGSAAIDAADTATMPSDDILGLPRDTNPDIGAFEVR